MLVLARVQADIELRFTVPKSGTAKFGACVLAKPDSAAPFVPHWEIVPNSNAAFDMVGVPGNKATLLGNASTADGCWALCNATTTCQEFAWCDDAACDTVFPPGFSSCSDRPTPLSSALPCACVGSSLWFDPVHCPFFAAAAGSQCTALALS